MTEVGIRRRTFLAGAACALPASASAVPGLFAPGDLVAVLDALASVRETRAGAPTVRVVVSPGCTRSLQTFVSARALREVSWTWIPYGGDDRGRRVCERALSGATPEALGTALLSTSVPEVPGEPRTGSSPASPAGRMAAQDRLLEGPVARAFWEATRAPLATPTLVYRVADGSARVVRGAPDGATLRDLVLTAS